MTERVPLIRTDDGEVVVAEVELADTFLSKALGLMFRRRFPEGHALVLETGGRKVHLHMLFVPFDIDAVFLDEDGVVRKVAHLGAWTGYASGRADLVVETRRGGADGVEPGDRLVIEA